MNFKSTIVAAVVSGAVLGVAAGFVQSRVASADNGPINASGIANIACAASPGNWTDCTVTLTQSVPAGGSVAAMLESNQAQVLFCSEGNADPDFTNCGINGNAAVFYLPNGGGPGTQLVLSAQGAGGPNLAQAFNVGVSYTETPAGNPVDLGPSPTRLSTPSNAS
jgi:hypothetical protein